LDIVTPLTYDPASIALAPNGRLLAFVGHTEGSRQQIWLRPLDSDTAQPLAGTEGAFRLFWSPDSKSIAFFDAARLKRLDLGGGSVFPLADAPEYGSASGTWNRDGVIVFSSGRELQRVSSQGGQSVDLPRPAPPLALAGRTAPQFLPDGRHLLFLIRGAPEVRGVYVGSLDAPEARRLFDTEAAVVPAPPSHLLFLRQGTLFAQPFDFEKLTLEGQAVPVARQIASSFYLPAISASATGSLAYRHATAAPQREFAWFDRTGHRLGALSESERLAGNNPELSADGRRLAFEQTVDGNTDLWLFELPGGPLRRLTFDPAADSYPVWSPDGRRLVFMQSGPGFMHLRQKASSGTEPDLPFLETPDFKMPTGWSPDGRFIMYRSVDWRSATGRDLLVVPNTGDRKPFPYLATKAEEREGQFSPDGRWVAYQSNESGRFEIYVQPFPEARGKWQVSTDGGTQPRWRKDGRELFYIGLDSKLMAASITLAAMDVRVERPAVLFQTRLAGGALPGILKQQYTVAPDGRFLMNVETGDASAAPITLVLNWSPGGKP
jgi:Tol biopolymer transport system component